MPGLSSSARTLAMTKAAMEMAGPQTGAGVSATLRADAAAIAVGVGGGFFFFLVFRLVVVGAMMMRWGCV
jgi:hypothetical protein